MELLFLNIGTQEMILMATFIFVGLFPIVFAIIAVLDVFKRDFTNKSTERLLIILLFFIAPIIGPIIYFAALRKSYHLKNQVYS